MRIPGNIEGQPQSAGEDPCLAFPWPLVLDPNDFRVLLHPGVEPLFAWIAKGKTAAAPNASKMNAEFVTEEAAQRQPQRGPRGIATIMGAKPLLEVRPAWGFAVRRRC